MKGLRCAASHSPGGGSNVKVLEPVERPRVSVDFWRGVLAAGVVLVVLYTVFLGVFFLIGWLG